MSLPIIFRPEARRELDDAIAWYEDRRVGLGDALLNTVEQSLARIAQNPEFYAIVTAERRLATMPRFPYAVIYEWHSTYILVVAVFHASRDPEIWRTR